MIPAIIIFARVPRPGHAKTRLEPDLGSTGAAQLYAAFVADTASKALQAGVRVRWYLTPSVEEFPHESPQTSLHLQKGGDLGERLENAFVESHEDGYGPLVVIGTDSPTMPAERIQMAFDDLQDPGTAVIGPASDGGYYLLGLSHVRTAFFQQIQYSRSDVAERTREALRSEGTRIAELPSWYDIDSSADLQRLTAELRDHPDRAPVTRQWLEDFGLLA